MLAAFAGIGAAPRSDWAEPTNFFHGLFCRKPAGGSGEFCRVLGVELFPSKPAHLGGSSMFHSRWFVLFSCLAAAFLLGVPDAVYAHIGSGGNCAACHGNDRPNASQILSAKTFKNDANRKDTNAPDLDLLPVFEVTAGDPLGVDLQELVKATTDLYAVALGGRITNIPVPTDNPTTRHSVIPLISGSVSGSLNNFDNKLVFTLDPVSWATKPTGANKYYTQGEFAGTETDQTFTYHMVVSASTPSDYYPLTFTTAGGPDGAAMDWSDPQAFYLHVLSPVPEPSAFALLGFAVAGLFVWRRWKRNS
jgi:hypothetical protein